MNTKNYMNMEIPALKQNVAFARSAIASFACELNPTLEEVDDIKTAISEAVTNCLVHAYPHDEKGIIKIETKIIKNELHISIEDFGIGIEDTEKAMEPFFTTGIEGERSGMGFTMIKALMDSLNIESNKDKGTKINLVKKFKSGD